MGLLQMWRDPWWRSRLRTVPNYSSALSTAGDPTTAGHELRYLFKYRYVDREVLAALYANPAVSPRMRRRVLRRYERIVTLHEILERSVTRQIDADILKPLLVSADPVVLHTVLQRINTLLDDADRAGVYARLALAAGPEAVWALELERVGTTAAMSASVRESMNSGSVEPLVRKRPPS